jgi:site-specific DNA recombinase
MKKMGQTFIDAILYARVSSKEQEKEGFSIPAQLQLLKEYAQSNGFQVIREFIDVETAKATGRKQFRGMIKFFQTNPHIKTLLVEKTDRLYRNFHDYATLEDFDVEIHLVKEGEILSKHSRSHVKFIHGIKVLMAKNYIDNLSEEVKKGHLEKVRQGEYPAKAPLGYFNNTKERTIEIDQGKAKFVRRMFELAATGQHSFKTIRETVLLEGLEYYSPKGRLSKSHVERILKNPFYTGSFLWNGALYQGNYPPLISRTQFDLVQTAIGNRQRGKHRKHIFAYSGLLLCGKCGCFVTAELKKGRYVYYHCTKSKGPCDEMYYREEDLTPQFDTLVKGITIDPHIRDWLVQALKESHKEETAYNQETTSRLHNELKKVKNRFDQLYLDKVDRKVSEAFWMEKSREWQADQDRILDQIRAHQGADRQYYDDGLKLLELASRAYELYAKQSPEQKNKFLKIVLSNCTLEHATVRPIYKKPFDLFAKGVETGKWGE